MRHFRSVLLLTSNLFIAAACGGGGDGDGTSCPISGPNTWSAPAWNTNAAEALALRAQLDALVGATGMRGVEQGNVTLTRQQLDGLYEAGTVSVADVTTPTYDAVVNQAFDEFVAAIAAGPGDPINDSGLWTPGPNGGIFGEGNRGMNAGGLEVRQIVDKGLFAGGALYNYAVGLTAGTITPATIDAIAAAWGSNENLDPAGTLTDSANYSNQMKFFEVIAEALTDAKAYAADANCTDERDEALVTAFRNWEQSMLARTVYYANVMKTELETGTTDDDLINGLHELGEGFGLAFGFKGVESPSAGPLAGAATQITAADVDQIATAVGVNATDLNASTTALFIEDTEGFADAVAELEGVVADVYDLTEAEIAAYRAPTGD